MVDNLIIETEEQLKKAITECKNNGIGTYYLLRATKKDIPFTLKLDCLGNAVIKKYTRIKEGIKHSSNKIPMSILLKQFPNALQAVALSGLYGHKKYEDHDKDYLNYKRVGGEDTYLDAGLRHQLLCKPEQEESGLPPKFHVAWNALADLEIFLENNEIDVSKVAELNIPIWENEFKK